MGHTDIRIGTLLDGLGNPAKVIPQILPHGFESFQITFWRTCVGRDLERMADEVLTAMGDSGAVISSLGIFGNPLGEADGDSDTRESWERLIDVAPRFGCDIVAGFTGRVAGEPLEASIPRLREIFSPLAERAGAGSVRLAFENCTMGGTWATGNWNIAIQPAAWELIFEALPFSNLGLEWEPCHQMVQLIEPRTTLRDWLPKIFHVHGKDASVDWDVIRREGVFGRTSFAAHRTPGFGDSNWTQIISDLRLGGFRGSIDIEGWHDPVYCGPLEMTGQVYALNYLKKCRGGDFVENPRVDKEG